MGLRENITTEILKQFPIPEDKVDKSVKDNSYYKNYADNLFCGLGDAAKSAYDEGNGAETKPQKRTKKIKENGEVVKEELKICS